MTPRFDPRWPPVLVTTSRISLRISAARAGSSSGLSLLMSLVALILLRRFVISVFSGDDEIRDLTEPLTVDPHKTNSRFCSGNFPRGNNLRPLQPVDAGHVPPPLFVSIQYIIHRLKGKTEVEAVACKIARLGGARRQGPQVGRRLEERRRLLLVDLVDVRLG